MGVRLTVLALITVLALQIACSNPIEIRVEEQPKLQQKMPSNLLVGISKGNLAPEFSVITIDGEAYSLSTLSKTHGKPLILYFWATWCPYCHQDFMNLKTLYPNYKENVDIIAINLDSTETSEQISNYAARIGISGIKYAVANESILIAYNVAKTTTKFVIGDDGVILWSGTGVASERNWKILLEAASSS